MQQLREKHGPGTVRRALRFAAIQVEREDATRGLLPEITAEREKVRGVEDTWLEAKERRVAATATLEYQDGELDEAVMALSREARVLVDGDLSDPRWLRLFPMAPSTATAPVAGEAQDRYVANAIDRLKAEASGELAPLAHHAALLEARLEAMRATQAERTELFRAETAAWTDLRIALDSAKRFYNRLYPRLLLLLDGREALTETFFLRIRDRRGSGDDGGTGAEADDAAGAAG